MTRYAPTRSLVNSTPDFRNGLTVSLGNVGIGTSSPATTLEIAGTGFAGLQMKRRTDYPEISTGLYFDSVAASGTITLSGATLTVVTTTAGAWAVGQVISGTSITSTVTITALIPTTGGTGGNGTYTVTNSPSQTISGTPVAATGINPGGNNYAIRASAGGLDFLGGSVVNANGGTSKVYFSSAGNVGIGTISPESLLSVRKDTAGGRGGEISIVNGATATIGSEASLNFALEGSTYSGDLGNAQIKAIMTNTNGAADLVHSLWSGSGFLERMRITSAGNVGIGTISPSTKLHVVGDTTIGGNLRVGSSSTSNHIVFSGVTGDNPSAYTNTFIGQRLYAVSGAVNAGNFTAGNSYVILNMGTVTPIYERQRLWNYTASTYELTAYYSLSLGTISGFTMTQHTQSGGAVAVGQILQGPGIADETYVVSGAYPTWTISKSHSIGTAATSSTWIAIYGWYTRTVGALFTALDNGSNSIGATATARARTAAGNFVIGINYMIVTVSTGAGSVTDFTSIGASNNNTGTIFTATGVGSGTGTALSMQTVDLSELFLFNGNDHISPTSILDRIRMLSGSYIFQGLTDYIEGTFENVANTGSVATRLIIKENDYAVPGAVGIATDSPTSTLHVSGSQSAKVNIALATATTLDATQYIITTPATGNIGYTLPSAATAANRVYIIKRLTPGTVIITPASGQSIETGAANATFSIPAQYDSYTFVSDGTSKWYII